MFKRALAPFLLFILSFGIVAFGQPARLAALGIAASLGGYALFWFSLSKESRPGICFLKAFIWFFGVSAVQLSWMTSTEYQGSYILFVYVGLNAFLAAQFVGISLWIQKLGKRPIIDAACIASVWTLLELLRIIPLCGFTWNPVGLSLSYPWVPLQCASLFGIYGLSFWVILTNALLFFALRDRRIFSYALGAFLLPYAIGGILYAASSHWGAFPEGDKNLKIAIVQTGLSPAEKSFIGERDRFIPPLIQWKMIINHLKSAGEGPLDMIVLPEYTVSFPSNVLLYQRQEVDSALKEAFRNTSYAERVSEFCTGTALEGALVNHMYWARGICHIFQAEVIIGLDQRVRTSAGKWENRNAAFYLSPKNQEPEVYAKQILLPLAEYLPFSWLKSLVASYGIQEFYTHGKETRVFWGSVPFSATICYEETFPGLVRKFRQAGARLLLNLTNDGWYPDSSLPLQHLYLGRLRAVENGIPLIRSCNTGVSCAIDRFGEIQASFVPYGKLSERDRGALITNLSLRTHSTLYSLFGDIPLIISCLFVFILFLFRYRFKL